MFSFPTILFVICTAYTATFDECGKTDGITASGHVATQGITVACDGLPLGTEVVIDGHTYIIQDRFGAGHGKHRMDIYMEQKADAFKFGRQVKIVEIKEKKIDERKSQGSLLDSSWRGSYFPYC